MSLHVHVSSSGGPCLHAQKSCSPAAEFRSWWRAASTPVQEGRAGTAAGPRWWAHGGGSGSGLGPHRRREARAAAAPGRGGREELTRAAAAISHQMSPSAAKAAPGADNGRAGQGAGRATRGQPHSRASADTYSPAATQGLPSPLPWRLLRLPSPPGCLAFLLHPSPRPHPHLLITSSFRTPDRYYLLQEAIPGLPLSGPHSTWLPNLHVCPGATPTPTSSPDFQRYH